MFFWFGYERHISDLNIWLSSIPVVKIITFLHSIVHYSFLNETYSAIVEFLLYCVFTINSITAAVCKVDDKKIPAAYR